MKASDIFHKTMKGQAEMESRSRDLSMKQRRVLILVNGSNDCAELKRLSLSDNIGEILQALIDGGFIDDGASTNTAIAAQDYASEEKAQEPEADAGAADEIEAAEFMCNTLLTFANRVRVSKLIDEIRTTGDSNGLKELIKPWYQAISETPGGMYQADDLRTEVLKILDNSDI